MLMSFLESFKSEFRIFQWYKIEINSDDVWQKIEVEQFMSTIPWILFLEKKNNWNFNGIWYEKKLYKLYSPKDFEIKKWDKIKDWNQVFKVYSVDKSYIFNAKYDHNKIFLELIE